MRIGSVCSGVDGLALGLEWAGLGHTVWHAEVDADACKVLAERWPGVPNHGDLKEARWERAEPIDILVGGYPCQPFSVAGDRRGADDERHLWPHVLNALRVLRPPLALFENVAGHVSLGLDIVLADLAAVGFDAQWGLVRASDVGAPHRRERVFILATDATRPHGGGGGRDSKWEGRAGAGGPTLATAIDRLLPTPQAHEEKGRPGVGYNEGNLSTLVTLLPTPTTADGDRGPDYARATRPGAGGDDLLTTMAKLLPTPTAGDASGSGSRNLPGSKAHPGVSLTDLVQMGGSTTPRAQRSTGASTDQRSSDGSASPDGQLPLRWTSEND